MAKLPKVLSLVSHRFEDGEFSGVPRFDWELRRVFPELVSVRNGRSAQARLRWLAWREPDTIVITGGEASVSVPERLRTIVMHHGCAQTHFERDPSWRDADSRRLCRAQSAMYRLPNRWFVALARWTAEQFSAHYAVPLARIIPSWVESISRSGVENRRPVVLGDFRSINKGSETFARLARSTSSFEFRTLRCSYSTRARAYSAADVYACLSLSEGGSFAFSDGEAATLPLVTTDVGNHLEYTSANVISWRDRDVQKVVLEAIDRALATRRGPSFFEDWTFAKWRKTWRELVEEVADERGRNPVIEVGRAQRARDGAGRSGWARA